MNEIRFLPLITYKNLYKMDQNLSLTYETLKLLKENIAEILADVVFE